MAFTPKDLFNNDFVKRMILINAIINLTFYLALEIIANAKCATQVLQKFILFWQAQLVFKNAFEINHGLLNRWTSQLDLGITTGGLESVVSVHNST